MTQDELKDKFIEQCKIAFPWMLTDIKHRSDIIKPDDYSPELQHAIGVGEILELIE